MAGKSDRIGRFVSLAAVCLAILSCAEIAPPPGGPEDTVSPFILETTPPDGAVSVSRDSRITITFSEPMDRESVLEKLAIHPDPGSYSTKWRGPNMHISFRDSLAEDMTYLLSIGPESMDSHGVKSGRPFAAGFSTGDSLAPGEFEGIVLDDRGICPEATVWLLSPRFKGKADHSSDEDVDQDLEIAATEIADEGEMKPVYAASTGSNGEFLFRYIVPGNYSLFAFEDKDGDGGWDTERERAGWARHDPDISGNGESSGASQLFIMDPGGAPPEIERAEALSNHVIEVEFSEPVVLTGIFPGSIRVEPSGDNEEILPAGMVRDPDGTSILMLFQERFATSNLHRLRVDGMEDLWGQPADTLFSAYEFYAPSEEETLSTPVMFRAGPGETLAGRDSLLLILDRPACIESPPVSVVDDALGLEIPGTVRCAGNFKIVFVPESDWRRSDGSLSVFFDPGQWGKEDGDVDADKEEIWKERLRIVDRRRSGSISVILDAGEDFAGSRAVVRAISSGIEKRRACSTVPGKVLLQGLAEGEYIIEAFIDIDGNGFWTPPGNRKSGRIGEPRIRHDGFVEVKKMEVTGEILLLFED